jgi:hypothetical protein
MEVFYKSGEKAHLTVATKQPRLEKGGNIFTIQVKNCETLDKDF